MQPPKICHVKFSVKFRRCSVYCQLSVFDAKRGRIIKGTADLRSGFGVDFDRPNFAEDQTQNFWNLATRRRCRCAFVHDALRGSRRLRLLRLYTLMHGDVE